LLDENNNIIDSEVTKEGLLADGETQFPDYWSKTGWPELENPNIPTSIIIDQNPSWNGIGIYTDGIIGLTDTLTYYVKAFSQNSAGTGYGNETNFKINLA